MKDTFALQLHFELCYCFPVMHLLLLCCNYKPVILHEHTKPLPAGNRAGKRNRVIHAHDEAEHLNKRVLRDRSVKSTDSSTEAAKLSRKRKLEQQGSDVKRRKPGRPPGRPPVLLSPGIAAKGPLPAGWSVSLKDSMKEPGKQYKQYKVCSRDMQDTAKYTVRVAAIAFLRQRVHS